MRRMLSGAAESNEPRTTACVLPPLARIIAASSRSNVTSARRGAAMSVFICWSGDRSHVLARALKALLVGSLPSLSKDDVFISDSIEKGANWFNSIETRVDKARRASSA
jgi:hypothetical protein